MKSNAVRIVFAMYLVSTLCVAVLKSRRAEAADVTISVIFSDASGKASNLVSDFAVATGWTTNISDGMGGTIPNPLNRTQWSSERIKAHMRETIKAYRANVEVEKTRTKTLTDTDAEIIFK